MGSVLCRALSADEMHEAVMKELPRATVFIGAAAVADYRPVGTGSHEDQEKRVFTRPNARTHARHPELTLQSQRLMVSW